MGYTVCYMETETKGGENKFAMYFFILFLFVFIFFLLPDSWFKSKVSYSKENSDDALVLLNKKLSKDYLNAPSDTSKPDSTPNWKKALLESVDPSIINATKTKEQLEAQKRLDDPNNLTSQVSKNAYAISTYLSQQGTVDQKTIENISKNIVENSLNSSQIKSKIHTSSEFKTTSKNDVTTLKNYGNDLAKKIYSVFMAGNKDDLVILSDYLNTEDPTILKKYDKEIAAFTKLRDDLLKMTVPKSMLEMHTKEVNVVEAYLNDLIIFSNSHKDPLRTVVTIEEYRKDLINFYEVIREYNHAFAKQNIFFTTKEYGYILFNEKMANIKE